MLSANRLWALGRAKCVRIPVPAQTLIQVSNVAADVFKGAPSAPRAQRRVTAYAATAGKAGADSRKRAPRAPRGTRRTAWRPFALVRQHMAAAAEARIPGRLPRLLSAATRRAGGPSSRRSVGGLP